MEKRIKVIWDFRGPAAEKTAIHYELHLKEYLKLHGLTDFGSGIDQKSPVHTIAFMVVESSALEQVKQDLKPHRGEWMDS